jgi:hypothetical protein
MDHKHFQLEMDAATFDFYDTMAGHLDRTISEVMRTALRYYMLYVKHQRDLGKPIESREIKRGW